MDRIRASINPIALGLLMVALAPSTSAAELIVDEGVVVKFGEGAGMDVRAGLRTAPDVVFTSVHDGSVGGTTSSATPERGDWRGVHVRPATAQSDVNINGLEIRYAGGGGQSALQVSGRDYVISGLSLLNNQIGVRAAGTTALVLRELSLLSNGVGLEADREADLKIEGSELQGNLQFGAANRTPTRVVDARGNWWGNASGPRDAVGNPSGTGDAVTTGVNYGQPRADRPLVDCRVTPADGRYVRATQTVALSLSCRNADRFRVTTAASFSDEPFSAISAQTVLQLPPVPGEYTVRVEFRGAGSAQNTVTLPQALRLDPVPPTVAFTAPAEGAQLAANTRVQVTASDAVAVTGVQFEINGTSFATDSSAPYEAQLVIDALADGDHVLAATAENRFGQRTRAQRLIRIRRDQTGPVLSDLRFAGAPLANGLVIASAGTVSVSAVDTGGLASVGARLGTTALVSAGVSGNTHRFTLTADAFADGDYTLTIRAEDRSGNVSTETRSVRIAVPVPAAPVFASPTAQQRVTNPSLIVSGSAAPGSQVTLFLNGDALDGALIAGANGLFSRNVTLPAEGNFTLAAEAANARGTGPRSAPVAFSYQQAPPTIVFSSPVENAKLDGPIELAISAVAAEGIRHVEVFDGSTRIARIEQPPYSVAWSVATLPDGPRPLRAVLTTTTGRTAETTRNVVVAKAPPPPEPVVTPYVGVVDGIVPAESFGDVPVRIAGRALGAEDGTPVPNSQVQLVLQSDGFERRINVTTDAAGAYSFPFQPQAGDAGTYTVRARHPQQPALPAESKTFRLDRLSVSPSRTELRLPRTVPTTLNVAVRSVATSSFSGVRLVADPALQPSGSLPAGLTVESNEPVGISAGQQFNVPVRLTASASTPEAAAVILALRSATSGSANLATVRVDLIVSNPQPALTVQPAMATIGVVRGTQAQAVVTLGNEGFAAATGVELRLLDEAGTGPAPAWLSLGAARSLAQFPVGERLAVPINAAPPANVADGVYRARLRIDAAGGSSQVVPVAVSVTQSGQGNVAFHVENIYTNTLDENGRRILGLANARIRVQNEAVPSIERTVTTDADGRAVINDLPVGNYVLRANAANHEDAQGRFRIQPGVTIDKDVFLDFAAVSFDWSVTETTITDRYDVVLNAVYQTRIPMPVLLIEPTVLNLPDMQVGEEVSGEITISNYGLIRAEGVLFEPPKNDGFFKYEFEGEVPTTLEAKQRVTLRYKVTALAPLPGLIQGGGSFNASKDVIDLAKTLGLTKTADLLQSASSGGCASYRAQYGAQCTFECANGDTRGAAAPAWFGKTYGSGCGGGGGGAGGGAGGGGAGGWGGGGIGTAAPIGPTCAPECTAGTCCTNGAAPAGKSGGSGSGPSPSPQGGP